MATFQTSLVIARPLAPTFAFVTNFANAPTWDPRTYGAWKTTTGPVGVGTRFVIRGGVISRTTLDRFRVPIRLRPATELEYEVIAFEPEREMVVRGESALLRYEDRLTFSAEGASGTRLHYAAMMELKGVGSAGDLLIRPLLDMIGEDATRGIPGAVAASVSTPHYIMPLVPIDPTRLPLPACPIVSPDDVRRVVALDDQAYLRNLLITQGYHDVSKTILARTGGTDMNWCTLGAWASKTAGTFIRDEEVPEVFRKLLEGSGSMRSMRVKFDDLKLQIALGAMAQSSTLIEIINEILHDCSTYIMVGNKVVYAELAQCFADFAHAFGEDTAPDPAKLAAFQARFTDGDPRPDEVEWGPNRRLLHKERGGQRMLREMVGHLYQAMFETDPKKRSEHILFANALGGLHEQTRLQTYIVGGINAPLDDTIVAWAHKLVDREVETETARGPINSVIDTALPSLARLIKRAWQDFSTDVMMTLTLPDGVLHLGHPIPGEPGAPLFPPTLETIEDPELAALLDRYGALDVKIEQTVFSWLQDRVRALFGDEPLGEGELVDVGALNWTDFDQRMRYILTLFRLRQQDVHLFQQPFTDEQRAAMFEGRIPPGPL